MSKPQASTQKKALRILYADDMEELRELMKMALNREGYTVECAADGNVALQKLSEQPAPFDLIITDHHMPNMNGLELVSRLRTEQPYAGKILVFSSELSHDVNGAYRDLKVDKILYKPVPPSVMRQALAELFPPTPPSA
jgi:CheY-like chemotaxis protein